MTEAIWSNHFARRIAERLGYRLPGKAADSALIDFDPEAEQVVEEVTEAFRYLPADKIQTALDFAEFLRTYKINGVAANHVASWIPQKLREVRDLVLALKARYGTDHPADEKDYWMEEDERDLTRATWRRLEERDPWPEEDSYPAKEQGNAHPG